MDASKSGGLNPPGILTVYGDNRELGWSLLCIFFADTRYLARSGIAHDGMHLARRRQRCIYTNLALTSGSILLCNQDDHHADPR